MIQTNTTMREAFLGMSLRSQDVGTPIVSKIVKAASRGVGVTKRHSMWSVERRKRGGK